MARYRILPNQPPPLHPNKRRAQIKEDIEEFLARGGEIQEIPQGATGLEARTRTRLHLASWSSTS